MDKVNMVMSDEDRDTLSYIISLNEECMTMRKDINDRHNDNINNIDIQDRYNTLWSKYEELMRSTRYLMDSTVDSGTYDTMKGLYDIYMSEYNMVRSEMNEAYSKKTVDMNSMQHVDNNDIYTDIIYDIHMYEDKKIHMIHTNTKQYILGLIPLIKKSLSFITNVFKRSDNNDHYFFYLSHTIIIRWIVMMMNDKDNDMNKDELLYLSIIDIKSKDIINLLSEISTDVRSKINNGADIKYETIDMNNKFSSYIKNIIDTMNSNELILYNDILLSRYNSVVDVDSRSNIIDSIQQERVRVPTHT